MRSFFVILKCSFHTMEGRNSSCGACGCVCMCWCAEILKSRKCTLLLRIYWDFLGKETGKGGRGGSSKYKPRLGLKLNTASCNVCSLLLFCCLCFSFLFCFGDGVCICVAIRAIVTNTVK